MSLPDANRLVTLWNALPDTEPITRFKDRKSAVKRFWAALNALPLGAPQKDSKQARILTLLKRPAGASMAELTAATGWQSHSVRGVISGALRKSLGLKIKLEQDGNNRVYRIVA